MSIKPELGGGFRDYLPDDMIPRQRILDSIRSVFEKFGFLPLDTPVIEREEILTGGDENFSKQIFRIRSSSGEDNLALRFDLTVPLARVIAAYPSEIQKPFKRYQIGKAYRGESSQKGRFREFIQCDADIVGAPGVIADAEIIALIYETLFTLGFKEFVVRVNNRKILNSLSAYAKFDSKKNSSVLRIIDKLDRDGWKIVKRELESEKSTELSESQTDLIKKFIDLRSEKKETLLGSLKELMKNSPEALEGIEELQEIIQYVRSMNVPEKYWTIDLSVARGLGYYTGPVFEAQLTNLPSIGSVFAGGRYDGLVARFSSAPVPATGASLGVDRLFAAMEELKMIKQDTSITKVLMLNFDPTLSSEALEIVTELREKEISSEIYMGQETTLKGQLTYGIKREIPIVLIFGSDEKKNGMVQVKDTKKRTQDTVLRKDLLQTVKQILS